MSKLQSQSQGRVGRPPSLDRYEISEGLDKALAEIDFFDDVHDAEGLAEVLPDASSYPFLERFRAGIRRLIVLKRGDFAKIVEILGRSRKTIDRYLEGAPVQHPTVEALCEATGIPTAWMFSGVNAEATAQSHQQASRQRINSSNFMVGRIDQFVLIPRYNVSAAAGSGLVAMNEDVREMMAFRRDWLRSIGVSANSSGVMMAHGDSMSPTIPSGSIMLVDFSAKSLMDGAIFVLVRSGLLVVKRVEILHKAVLLISDNPIYERERIPLDDAADLSIAGQVKWVARTL